MELDHYRYFVYGLLILGSITKGFAKPTANDDNKFNSTVDDEVDNMQSDYEEPGDYSDDDTGLKPDSPPTVLTEKPEPTEPPYFNQKDYIKQAKPNDNITLECSVQNLGVSNVILWYKEDKVIGAGSKAVGDRYIFDEIEHTLTIVNATEKDSGNYYCEVQPQKLRLHVNVEISELSNHAEAQSASNMIRSNYILPSILMLLLTTFFLRI